MINVSEALLLGTVQGITEWLPVSSSGHLAILNYYLGLGTPVAFDVFLHLASAFVLLLFLRKQIADIIKAVAKLDFQSASGRLFLFIIAGSFPTALIGLALKNRFEAMFLKMTEVAAGLVFTGILLVLSRRGNEKRELGWGTAFFIGIFQGLALAPGISRSGATISSALLFGLKREAAVNYSFLIAIPAILGATILEAKELTFLDIGLISLAVGFITSLIVGYLTLSFLEKLVRQKKFSRFALYCFILGALLITLS